MPIEHVGYRRLYHAHGVAAPDEAIQHRLSLQPDLVGIFYLGPYPPFGLFDVSTPKYAVPGPTPIPITVNYISDLKAAGRSEGAYTDIAIFRPFPVDDDISRRFRAQEPDSAAPLWHLAEESKDLLLGALDLIAGTVGLTFHRQFVIELLNEHPIALRGSGTAVTYASPVMEVLGNPTLTEQGKDALAKLFTALESASPESMLGEARALHWLLRAWPHQESVSRFLALFIPLEMVLQGIRLPPPAEQLTFERFVRRTVAAKAPKGTKAAYKRHLDALYGRWHPSLDARFRALATSAGLPHWERDVAAFKKFNALRNALLHRGDPKVSFRLELSPDVVRTLEDLVERYVCVSLYGHAHVYQHRFRPSP